MAKLDEYRLKVQQILEKYAQYKPSYGDVEIELIFDTQRDHLWPYHAPRYQK